MPNPVVSRRLRGLLGAAAAASLVVLAACLDKEVPTQSVVGSPRVNFQLAASFQRQNAPSARTIDVNVGYSQQGKFVQLVRDTVPAVAGTTVSVPLSVDLTTCLADTLRDKRPGGGCPLLVSVALRDSVKFALDSVMLTGSANVGKPPILPPVDLANTRFTVREWVEDDPLRLGGAVPTLSTGVVGLASGSGLPTLYSAMTDTSGDPALGIFQNGSWQFVRSHLGRGNGFNGIAPLAANDVWIAANSGLYHYDGATFTAVSQVRDSLLSVAALVTPGGGRFIVAGGFGGIIWQGDGATWTKKVVATATEVINETCVTGPNEAFATSVNSATNTIANTATGSLFHFNGTAWSGTLTSIPNFKIELQCPAPGIAYAIASGSGTFRWNGTGWVGSGVPGLPGRLFDWGITSPSEMYAYGDSNAISRAFYVGTGTSWREVGRSSFTQALGFIGGLEMWADPRSGAAYHLSAFGRLEQVTPNGYHVLSYIPAMRDLIVTSPTSAFAVGWNLFLARWNGSSWTVDAPPAGTPGVRILQGVWSDGPSNAWAVGGASTILRWNGTAWSVVSDVLKPITGITDNYNAVWGVGSSVIMVGDTGIVACQSSGGVCSRQTGLPGAGSLFSVWGTAANNVIAVGQKGRILHFDGTSWSLVESPTSRTLARVWGSSASDVWAVGDSVLIHFDGTKWANVPMTGALQAVQSPAPSTVASNTFQLGLWGSGPKDVYVGGENGHIARFDGVAWSDMTGQSSAHRVLAISGSAGFGAMAILESQTNRPGPTFLRGVGANGGFGAVMTPPAVWP
ncbi:MAG TPA: hypothetical protein VN706_21480 [Gemmatimonadaceae bacterium]|nr:hypothetical protein [Gemmatimonadaceae bacterium]